MEGTDEIEERDDEAESPGSGEGGSDERETSSGSEGHVGGGMAAGMEEMRSGMVGVVRG